MMCADDEYDGEQGDESFEIAKDEDGLNSTGLMGASHVLT
jgi:hypothetical protein